MEMYLELTIDEAFSLIKKGETENLHHERNNSLHPVNSYSFDISKLNDIKFFIKKSQEDDIGNMYNDFKNEISG